MEAVDINLYKYGQLTSKLNNGDIIEIDKINAEPIRIEVTDSRINECKVSIGCRSLILNNLAESWMLENVTGIKINGESILEEVI